MVKKEIFHEVDAEVSRLRKAGVQVEQPKQLTVPQNKALAEIAYSFKEKDVVLLHGVTGSGKTEIYMELIQEQIDLGKQVLYLLPEIALTAQIINRLRKRFGDAVGVYHSKFNHSERIEIWQHVQHGKYKILLGARSALYLPFLSPGLVIVDEEHDYSFKQHDPAPRYHARDTAIYLASIWKCKTLLGTATPSVESYHNAITGKFGYVELTERYAGMLLPEVRLVDMKMAVKEKKVKAQFSNELISGIDSSMSAKEQVILFQNRRGYSPFIVCEQCGWTPHCINCDVNLVYHKMAGELRCHYCGYRHEVWHACAECGSTRLLVQGFGTEKIEEELQLMYPELRIARLDLDAVKTKAGHEKVLSDFEDGQIDVMVGTQMVTKGLDFDHVSLVGILSADQILNFSDFRSAERGYQLMMQVSGRAGRKNRQGLVLIQAMNVKHPVLQWVINHETHQFYEEELKQRRKFLYPPYVRLIRVTIRHKDKATAEQGSKAYVQAVGLAKHFKILGPVQPPIGRVRNKYLYEIVVKMETIPGAFADTKKRLKQAKEIITGMDKFKRVEIIPDVDPI
jgi:primosomal protein N' (replication factor Y)